MLDRIAAALSFDLRPSVSNLRISPGTCPVTLTHPVEKPVIALESNRSHKNSKAPVRLKWQSRFFGLFLSQGFNEVERRLSGGQIERLSHISDG